MSGRGQPGYGRGGRGAALLELISDPARKPGQQPQQPQQQRSSPTLQQEYAGRGAVSSVGRASAASGVPQPAPVGRGLASLLHQVKTEQQQQSQGAIPKKPLKTSPEPVKDVSPPQITSPGPSSPMGRGISAFLRHGQPTSPTAGGDASVLESPRQSIPVGRGITGLSMGRGLASPVEKTRPHVGSGDAPSSPVEPRAKTPPQVAAPKTPPKTPTPSPEPQPPTEELKQLKVQEKVEKVNKSGTAGQPVPIACNYIRMKCKFEAVYQYAVSFTPQVDSKSMRFRLVNEHRDVIGAVKAFDGAMLFLPIRLNEPITVMASKRPTDGSEVVVRVTLTKVLRPEECIQPYNVIFRKIMRILDMKQVARHYYDPNRAVSVPQHKLEIWPGYITSLREYEGGLLLLADVSHKVLRNENVLDFMYKIYQKNPKSFKDECTRQLVGNIVLTRYNNKTYRIDDIAWDKNPQSTFSYGHQGEEMTFVDYYLKAYNKKINDLEQPLLINHPKRKGQEASSAPPEVICLIPELSSLTGLTDEMRQDFRVMKDVASHTRVSPTQRALAMRSFMDSIKSSPEATAELSKWGLELDNDILKSQGRALPPEKIIFQTKSVMANQEADWGRDLTRESVICPVNLQCWMVVFTRRDANKAMDFIQMMKKVCPSMGIRVNEPVQLELQDDRTETYLRTIRESINTQIQMVVVIFPTSRDDRYNAIKKLCCVESPVPSQVIIARTISQQQKLRSVTQKVALQINCKLGGELWALDIPLKKLMVVGIDVYHDAAHGGKSVGAMVASTNFKLTRWYSRVCFQLPQQELIDGLKLCLTSALRKYHEVNHTLPDRVVVFRDGVGDGQLRVVSGYEVDQLKECFTHFGSTYDPKMAVVVVQKRINTRIFGDFHGQLDNPKPGLVLDHTVTMCNWYDYFLVSQHVRQGTVSPTHYVVVYDGSGLKPDHMQRLSYKLTHLYYNWPGTVRVPAPCQYAHKLAYLVGQNIRREPSQDLADRLFFL